MTKPLTSTLYPVSIRSRLVAAGGKAVKGEYTPNEGNLKAIDACVAELVSAGAVVPPSTFRESWLAAESSRLSALERVRSLG